MTSARIFLPLLLVAGLPVLAPAPASSQTTVGVGADFVSRYVWRGTDYGESFSIQPSVAISRSGFEVGAWGSYSLSSDGADYNEADLYASYTVEVESGTSVTVGVTDYYFPAPSARHGFSVAEAHYLEPFVSISGPSSLPVSMSAFAGVILDETDRHPYVEGGIGGELGGAELGLALGVVPARSDFYLVDAAATTNVSVTVGKPLPITDEFALPLTAAWIWNPAADRAHLVFGFRLSN